MKSDLISALGKTARVVGFEPTTIKVDYPENPDHGDFSTNVAMVNAKKLGINPKVLAEKIVEEFNKVMPDSIQSASIAGPGFINFTVKNAVFTREIIEISKNIEYGWSLGEKNKNTLFEYTDPNTFKVFHIGHLMANAIGESLSRLSQSQGATVTRICYPSDIGLHIAKSVWAMQKHELEIPADSTSIQEKTNFLGKMYVEGVQAYEADVANKDDIDALNKILYERSSPAIHALYEKGRAWSLEHYELLYKRLGTTFDDTIYESDMAPVGLDIVKKFLGKGVFVESEGAVVFKGEDHGLHTRVFINSKGLPTYEAKEVGLNITKFKKYPRTDESFIITASEQNDYFKVLKKALTLIDENIGSKTTHIGHGMMRFASGKMSSRTGKVITAEDLLSDIRALVAEKIQGRGFSEAETDEISDIIAIGAIKYTILRQSTGGDVIFDSSASISFEGDSGPYLQYATVRANSILAKAEQEGIKSEYGERSTQNGGIANANVSLVEKLITRFPDILERASKEAAPQSIANYLIALAGAFNSFYAGNTIVDKNDPVSPYRVALTKSFVTTMTNGLWVLGIKVPKKM